MRVPANEAKRETHLGMSISNLRSATCGRRSATARALVLGLAACAALPAGGGRAESSDWTQAHQSRVRLVSGLLAPAEHLAGIELELGEGWKTYWRSPGDAGGVPPAFDWSGSENVKAIVLYPAPKRFVDRSGETVGYKGGVTFPVRLEVADPGKPVRLRLKLEYGICREICVPAEVALALDEPAGAKTPIPDALASAIKRVPRDPAKAKELPRLAGAKVALAGDKPRVTFEAVYTGDPAHADAFAEGPGGVYVPLPHRTAANGNAVSYEIDLAGIDLADIKGKALTLTLTSDAGASEVSLPVE